MARPEPKNKRGSAKRIKKTTPARLLAGRVLRRVLSGQGSVRDQLDWSFRKTPPEPRDLGLVTELVYGAVRRLKTIDHILAQLSRRPLDKVDEGALSHLRLAAYQLIYLERIPAHAAVNEAVRWTGHQGARTFVNGILRNLGRLLLSAEAEYPSGVPRSRLLPAGARFWTLGRDLLPSDEEAWLAVGSGHPAEYVRRLIADRGYPAAAAVCEANNQTPPLSLRVNLRQASREDVLAQLAEAGFEAAPGQRPEAIRVASLSKLSGLEPFLLGQFSVQDETAMGVAPFLAPEPGQRVLDLCAAPGGKTMHLAEIMGEGSLIATDIDDKRLEKVREARIRLRQGFVQVLPRDKALQACEAFDRVLLDVPCSNTGVLRRRVEVRHRLDELDRAALAETQRGLLREGLEKLAPGGALVYATCSIDREEDEDLVAGVLAELGGRFKLEEEVLTLTSPEADGGYMARIVAV